VTRTNSVSEELKYKRIIFADMKVHNLSLKYTKDELGVVLVEQV